MVIERRISATFKDLPGGQILGPTFDYTHRLLEPDAVSADSGTSRRGSTGGGRAGAARHRPSRPRRPDRAGRGREAGGPVGDLTREPLSFPADRDLRLQALARGDEGFLLALGYSTQRGYARTHPFAGEIRMGEVEVELDVPELGFAVTLGPDHGHRVPDGQPVHGQRRRRRPQFTRGYGLVFGHGERKAMAMALCDRALRARELGEELTAPAQDEEFVLSHADNVQATGFVEHLKLPHYVDFQAELVLLRQLRAEHEARNAPAVETREAAE